MARQGSFTYGLKHEWAFLLETLKGVTFIGHTIRVSIQTPALGFGASDDSGHLGSDAQLAVEVPG